MRHIILISGKDSLATALVQTTRQPSLPYEFFFNDVGCELPETYAWLDKVSNKTGWPIQRVGKDLSETISRYGWFLPSKNARYCTRECKIEPMEKYIGDDQCTVYYGLRADEIRTGYVPIGKQNIVPCYPLREMGIDLRGVYSICDAQELAPPDFFWKRLYDSVATTMECVSKNWNNWLSRLEKTILFAGRTRANCMYCFFQRQYEFLWLYETHRDLFDKSQLLEKSDYSFMKDVPLVSYYNEEFRERVFSRRVNSVCKTIVAKQNDNLFGEIVDSEISLTSCGLLCGK